MQEDARLWLVDLSVWLDAISRSVDILAVSQNNHNLMMMSRTGVELALMGHRNLLSLEWLQRDGGHASTLNEVYLMIDHDLGAHSGLNGQDIINLHQCEMAKTVKGLWSLKPAALSAAQKMGVMTRQDQMTDKDVLDKK